MKFTDRGGRVTSSGEATDERVAIVVRDTELGLAISRDLACGMGGDLLVESAPGAGSPFTLGLCRA